MVNRIHYKVNLLPYAIGDLIRYTFKCCIFVADTKDSFTIKPGFSTTEGQISGTTGSLF